MPNYQLTQKDAKYLTLEINGTNYNIPLASTLKNKDVRKIMNIMQLQQVEQYGQICDFLAQYMTAELVDDLTMADTFEIFNVWVKANNTADGISLGESLASPNS